MVEYSADLTAILCPMPDESIMRAVHLLRDEGPLVVWLRFVQWLGVYRRLLVSAGVDRRAGIEARIPLEYGRLGPDEIAEYLRLRPDQDRARIRARFDAGARCVVARHEGRIVAAAWYSLGRAHIDYLDCDLILASDVAYLEDEYVAEDARGLRVADGLASFRLGELHREGVDRVIGLFWPENHVAIRRSRRIGDQASGRLVRWQIGPWRRFVLRLHEGRREPVARVAPRGRSSTRVRTQRFT